MLHSEEKRRKASEWEVASLCEGAWLAQPLPAAAFAVVLEESALGPETIGERRSMGSKS